MHTNTVYVESDKCIGCGTCRQICRAFSYDKALEEKSLDWLMGKA